MSQGQRHPFDFVQQVANHLWTYLSPAAPRIAIAGSVRRLSCDPKRPADATCGDIELVLDGGRQEVGALLSKRPEVFHDISGGERLVKCNLHTRAGAIVPVQLNFATTISTLEWGALNNYGWKMILATGDWEWNRQFVLDRRYGGLKPSQLEKAEKGPTRGFWHEGDTPKHMPTEQDVFDLFGLPFVEPHRRTAVTARELRTQLANEGAL